MKHFPAVVGGLVLLFFLGLPAKPSSGLDIAGLDACVQAEMKKQGLLGVSVAVMQGGQLTAVRAYGVTRRDGPPLRTDTPFAIGSMTKQFTAACLLLLQQEGKLSLSDTVAKYYPALTRAGDIRLRDLMNQVSGYRDYYPLDFFEPRMGQSTTPDALITGYATRPLDFEPGARWSYSNTGYLILGRVIEKVSGESYGAFLQKRILTPLGMTHTVLQPPDDALGSAHGYTRFALATPEPAPREADGWMFSAGALSSTPADIAKWDLALMSGKVLTPEAFREMTAVRRLADGRSTGYAGGLFSETVKGQTVLSHEGNVSGFSSEDVLVPGSRSALVVLEDADYGSTDPIRRFVEPSLLAPRDGSAPDPPPVSSADIMPIPKVAGPPALSVARQMFDALQQGTVERSLLGPDYAAFLTPLKLHEGAMSLRPWGTPSSMVVTDTQERGGMEVTLLRLTFTAGDLTALLYRTPDGKVQEFLVRPE